MFYEVVIQEMLKALNESTKGLHKLQLKHQDGTKSSIITKTDLWKATITGKVLEQNEIVEFSIDTTSGPVNVSGFNLYFEDDVTNTVAALDYNFENIKQYPNNGFFTFDGMIITVE